jgi:hypothetical protein
MSNDPDEQRERMDRERRGYGLDPHEAELYGLPAGEAEELRPRDP